MRFLGWREDVPALLAMDTGRVLDVLEANLRLPPHAEFVERLKKLRGGG